MLPKRNKHVSSVTSLPLYQRGHPDFKKIHLPYHSKLKVSSHTGFPDENSRGHGKSKHNTPLKKYKLLEYSQFHRNQASNNPPNIPIHDQRIDEYSPPSNQNSSGSTQGNSKLILSSIETRPSPPVTATV